MIELRRLTSEEWPGLYPIVLAGEPFAETFVPTLSHFKAAMADCEAFGLFDGGILFGVASFSNFVPLMDVCLHAVVDPAHRGRWISRSIFRDLFRYPFEELKLPRVSSYAMPDMTPKAGDALLRTGFKLEGRKRKAALFPDGYHDLLMFGMLREECRWI